jgi:hypothetical protein
MPKPVVSEKTETEDRIVKEKKRGHHHTISSINRHIKDAYF